ncbi:RIP metalloprotease [Candidatus Lariskella endosymbiont of Hedychridium roseum]|uniref:M50 family metallopeptidase n=1 Tax=Candidatus Lariskella endosymbiont of Hedychridium roseum TaxID=3077949 RepID=UPI0030D57AC9
MMSLFYSILGFLVVVLVTVSVHEFGHFYIARLCGVKVDVFSIGFGKAFYRWIDKYGTEFRICTVPLGGYVKMFGDKNIVSAPDFEAFQDMNEEEKRISFYHKPLWKKACIVAAGPAFNYLLAIVLMSLLFSVYGKVSTTNQISHIAEKSIASYLGLLPGDTIISINNRTINDVLDIKNSIASARSILDLKIEIMRDGQKQIYDVKEIIDRSGVNYNTIDHSMLGVNFLANRKEVNLLESVLASISDAITISFAMLEGLVSIIIHDHSASDLGGPIKIAQYSGESLKLGLAPMIWFVAMISLNLGLVNLLPIPMLDGGHLLYYLIESVTGRSISQKMQKFCGHLGFFILIALMLFATFNDIRGLIR